MSAETILIVDDEAQEREFMRTCLAPTGYHVTEAEDGIQALEKVVKERPDLILMDLMMPRLDGWTTCRYLRQDPRTKYVPVVIVTNVDALPDKLRALDIGVSDFLNKPVNAVELLTRVRSHLSLKHYMDELEHASKVLAGFARIIEERDAYTSGHGQRVGRLAQQLGRVAGLSPEDLKTLDLGATFHDIGKISVPDAVLRKPGPLTPTEWVAMKRHPIVGEDLCRPMRTLEKALPLIRHHHERMDGSGYPDGLKGSHIPLLVRILSVVDIFDALTTQRPYRQALTPPEAITLLRKEAGLGWWDPNVVDLCARPFLSAEELVTAQTETEGGVTP